MSEYDLFARLCDLEHKHLTNDIELYLGYATAWMWLALTTRRPCSTWHDSGHVKPA